MNRRTMTNRRPRGRWGALAGAAAAVALCLSTAPGAIVVASDAAPSSDALESRSSNFADVVAQLPAEPVVEPTPITASPMMAEAGDTIAPGPAELPEGGSGTLSLSAGGGTAPSGRLAGASGGSVGQASGSSGQVSDVVGGLPVTLATVEGVTAPSAVSVQVRDQDATEAAGVGGVVLDLADVSGDSGDDTAVEVTISYAEFAAAGGPDWASRLQFFALPACLLDGVEDEESVCVPVPLDSANDTESQTLTATVELHEPGTDPLGTDATLDDPQPGSAGTVGTLAQGLAAGGGVRVAVAAGSGGPSGQWGASSLAPSGSWSTSGATGAFTWSYPLDVPPTSGGLTPDLALSYSSAVSDGRTSDTNNQASWVGEGWSLSDSFIERTYVPCAQDLDKVDGAAPNNTGYPDKYAGDLCWGAANLTMSLDGASIELVQDESTKTWHAKNEDGTRVEAVTRARGIDSTTDYWVVTTVDGTRYSFGEGGASGADTQSVWTVPVFGNHTGEACHVSSFKRSSCQQVWRWNLDRVENPLGNTMRYTYTRTTGAYKSAKQATPVAYTVGGHLSSIEYGTRTGSSRTAGARVSFQSTPRCTGDTTDAACLVSNMADNESRWPDVPVDLYCTVDDEKKCANITGPAFFEVDKLSKIVTQTYDGAWHTVDSWSLKHDMYDPNAHTDNRGSKPAVDVGSILWLRSIQETGRDQVASSGDPDPAVFNAVFKDNRVQVAGNPGPPMSRPRVERINTQAGAYTFVAYTGGCEQLPSNPASNTALCYPVGWDYKHPGDLDWFAKYVVAQVDQGGGTSTAVSQAITTRYTYSQDATWVKPTGPLVKPKQVTYSDFRGFGSITTVVGGSDTVATRTVTHYLLGVEATRRDGLPQPGTGSGDQDHRVPAVVTDQERFAGQVYAVEQFDGANLLSRAVSLPSDVQVTATAEDGRTASLIGQMTTYGETYSRAGSVLADLTTRTTTDLDSHARVERVDDDGAIADTSDDTCTAISYAGDTGLIAKNMLGLPVRTLVTSGPCPTGTVDVHTILTDTRAGYDSAGRVVTSSELNATEGPGAARPLTAYSYTTTSGVPEPYGRLVAVTDARGRTTTTTYQDTDYGLPTKVSVTTPDPDGTGAQLPLTTSTVFDPLTGVLTDTIDANGKKTHGQYDELGRLTAVWYPDRAYDPAAPPTPSVTYAYTQRANGINAVVTSTIAADGVSRNVSSVIYDGLMRVVQTQSPSADAGAVGTDTSAARGRTVSATFYDSAGRVRLTTGAWTTSGQANAKLLDKPVSVASLTKYLYDGAGRVTDEVLYSGTSEPGNEKWRTVTLYDGSTTTVFPPAGGTTTATTADADGNTVTLVQHTARPQLEGSGRARTLVWAAADDPQETTYRYDVLERLVEMRDANDTTWTYGYDYAGHQVRAVDPDAGETTSAYDEVGQLTWVSDATGERTYTYDALGRNTKVSAGEVTLTSFAYDTRAKGQLTSSTRYVDGQSYTTSIIGYDDAYRVTGTKVTLPAVGNLAKLATRTFTTTYEYAADGQLAATTLPAVTQEIDGTSSTILGGERVSTYFDSASVPRWMAGGFGWGTYVANSSTAPDGRLVAMDLGNTYGSVVTY
ncbi:RHS repeat domain-containing protein, partial [Cellulomonas composti]|uniref:RHS repeat domain-containing protein n=1 Tax=Cellulomonas composti TaxID=266130 RepID=UPI0011BE5BAA